MNAHVAGAISTCFCRFYRCISPFFIMVPSLAIRLHCSLAVVITCQCSISGDASNSGNKSEASGQNEKRRNNLEQSLSTFNEMDKAAAALLNDDAIPLYVRTSLGSLMDSKKQIDVILSRNRALVSKLLSYPKRLLHLGQKTKVKKNHSKCLKNTSQNS